MTHNYIYNLVKHIDKAIKKAYSNKTTGVECVLEYGNSKKRVAKKENFLHLFNKKELANVKNLNDINIEQIAFKSFDTIIASRKEVHETNFSWSTTYTVEIPSANARLTITADCSEDAGMTFENVELVVSGKTIPIFTWSKQGFNVALIENKLFGIKERHYSALLDSIIYNIDYVYKRFEKIQEKKHRQHAQYKLNSPKFDDVKQSIKAAIKKQKR